MLLSLMLMESLEEQGHNTPLRGTDRYTVTSTLLFLTGHGEGELEQGRGGVADDERVGKLHGAAEMAATWCVTKSCGEWRASP